MGFLNSIIGWLVAFGAGFFGHVVAHDFCEITPIISRKIIKAAASRLPTSIRERYREEWVADLQAQSGAVARLAWSLGCLWSARRMRREAGIDHCQRTTFEFVLDNGEIITTDLPTFAAFTAAYTLSWHRWLRHTGALGVVVVILATNRRALRSGMPDLALATRLVGCFRDRRPRQMTRCFDGLPEITRTLPP
jgi:hypothetical protein